MNKLTFEDIKKNKEFNIYIEKGNEHLGVLGYTDHSAAHTVNVCKNAAMILKSLNYEERIVELAKIAGYIHDIGNAINRHNHAHTGAIMAFTILSKLNMDPEEISIIISAIGNHDEDSGMATSPVTAALIIADKTDVRRSRVRNKDFATFDIHDRVNYAVKKSSLKVDVNEKVIRLDIDIDTKICSMMDYFEIFLTRMLMCKRSAEFLKTDFQLWANGNKLL